MARAAWTATHRDARVRDLARLGKKVLGYHCCYVPQEIITASGAVPFRIMGDVREPVSQVDRVLESQMCPHVRNCIELGIKGRYDFLDGVIIPHTCDAVQRSYGFWRHQAKIPYAYHIDLPHVMGPAAVTFFRRELQDFQRSLEQWTGNKIGGAKLKRAIELHNKNRGLVAALYVLRKEHPPRLNGKEMLQVLIASLSLPVEESNDLLGEVLAEIKTRTSPVSKEAVRTVLYGCSVDNAEIIDIIEQSGAVVVMDDMAIGTRTFSLQVDESADPLDALAGAYLEGVRCPRTIVGEKTKAREQELEDRFGYLEGYCLDYDARGVILYVLRFCDPEQFDVPDLVGYLQAKGRRVLVLDDDYTVAGKGQLKTRVEAFVESLELEGTAS